MPFHLLPGQLAKGYEGEQSMPQMNQPTFQPQPFFQTQPSFQRQPSFQQMDFKQKVEALTNQFNQNYQNFQMQQDQQQLQFVYDKYLQDYGKLFCSKLILRVFGVSFHYFFM